MWNICVFELQCEQREEVYSSGSLQWPPPFGIQRLRFCWDRHRFQFLRSNSIFVFLQQFHCLSAPSRFSQRGQHRVPCEIRLSRSLLSLSLCLLGLIDFHALFNFREFCLIFLMIFFFFLQFLISLPFQMFFHRSNCALYCFVTFNFVSRYDWWRIVMYLSSTTHSIDNTYWHTHIATIKVVERNCWIYSFVRTLSLSLKMLKTCNIWSNSTFWDVGHRGSGSQSFFL